MAIAGNKANWVIEYLHLNDNLINMKYVIEDDELAYNYVLNKKTVIQEVICRLEI